jgi:hypothetical protein
MTWQTLLDAISFMKMHLPYHDSHDFLLPDIVPRLEAPWSDYLVTSRSLIFIVLQWPLNAQYSISLILINWTFMILKQGYVFFSFSFFFYCFFFLLLLFSFSSFVSEPSSWLIPSFILKREEGEVKAE